MIARTIRQHLIKEQEFAVHGRDIKVLSLFFVDSVDKYRKYGPDGETLLGEYAQIFEQEYTRIAAEPQFTTLLGSSPADAVAREAHQGYFSIDRRKGGSERLVDTKESTDRGRQQAGLAYEQIMRDKVGLTMPGTPIRFVFSHSALQEGWDNPNVFQICVLRNMGTERWRRQSIGRGLRLCVDGSGNRVYGFEINRLTVLANESYEEFADRLQREMADDLGIQFGLVTMDGLARLTYKDEDGKVVPVSSAAARTLYDTLVWQGYIDAKGKVQDSLREAVQNRDVNFMDLLSGAVESEAATAAVFDFIKRLAKPIDIKKARERVPIPVVEERIKSPQFRELWERIKHRTEYRLDVDEDALRTKLIDVLRSKEFKVPKRRGEWVTYGVKRIDQSGLDTEITESRRVDVSYADSEDLPDILSVLADRTQLTRETLAYVLTRSGTLDKFRGNPQAYIDQATRKINAAKAELLVGGVRYALVDSSRPAADRWYEASMIREADVAGYTGPGGNIVSDEDGNPVSFAEKSIYEYLVTDSQIEREYAKALLSRDDVKLFVKLPASFTIPTPLGTYNPDWAVAVEQPDGSRYIVFETKGTSELALLPPEQSGRIKSAGIHFDVISHEVGFADLEYAHVKDINDANAIIEGSA